MSKTVRQVWRVEDVLTDVTTAKLSNAAATYGVKRNDTSAVVVADGTSMTHVSTGVYEYEFAEPAEGLAYTAWVEIVYDSQTYWFEHDFAADAAADNMAVSYTGLKEIVGRKLYGIRESFSTAQTADINDAIKTGLHQVYLAHKWSFFRPRYTITTTAPQSSSTVTIVNGVVTLAAGTWPSWAATGTLSIAGGYYAIASRDSDSQLTLVDTTLDAAALTTYELGRNLYDLPTGYDAIEGPITYPPDAGGYYPNVRLVKESDIRKKRQSYEQFERPEVAAVVAVSFDPTVGSRRQIMLYPTPDDTYQLTARMRLRPTMIDSTNLYPVGGEVLSQVFIESCIVAGLRSLGEPMDQHWETYQMLLAQAIQRDKEESSPEYLGKDNGGEQFDAEYTRPIPTILFNGVEV